MIISNKLTMFPKVVALLSPFAADCLNCSQGFPLRGALQSQFDMLQYVFVQRQLNFYDKCNPASIKDSFISTSSEKSATRVFIRLNNFQIKHISRSCVSQYQY